MDFLFGVPANEDLVYDIETYPNVFTLTAKTLDKSRRWRFELSPRKQELHLLRDFIRTLASNGNRMVGFNNLGFDYPVVHYVMTSQFATVADIYNKAMSIIRGPDGARFSHTVWESDHIVTQIDLFKIHHFDNKARGTSLKVLEFNMRMERVEDLPFDVGINLHGDQIDTLLEYNEHDVDATIDFHHQSKEQIRFREQLTQQYGVNFMNFNDTKIGKQYFIMKLEEERPGSCYAHVNGHKEPRQTLRSSIALADVILPYIRFNRPEFQRILEWFKSQVITETKGVFTDVSCTVEGFQFDFGTGGIHGSVESTIVRADDEFIIEDWDVASYYPNLAIVNNFYPEHLGELFCRIYKEMYEQRKQYPKGSAENAMLKLALNGVYGDSNNVYSPFYDPQYTMSITVNGQLLLCMLAEVLMGYVEMVQINTDGLTIRYPRSTQPWVHQVAQWWQQLTGLTLENVEYSMMAIRDVNNYIAVGTDGRVKRKGAYEYELEWHQNHSALVVPRAAEAALVHGRDIAEFILNHDDVFDFMLRTKVPRGSILEWGGDRVSNVVRYYISTDGDYLEKVMPAAGPDGQYKKANGVSQHEYDQWHQAWGNTWNPEIHTKNQSVYEERRTRYHDPYTVRLCNDVRGHSFDDINYDWYIREAEKLVKPLRGANV